MGERKDSLTDDSLNSNQNCTSQLYMPSDQKPDGDISNNTSLTTVNQPQVEENIALISNSAAVSGINPITDAGMTLPAEQRQGNTLTAEQQQGNTLTAEQQQENTLTVEQQQGNTLTVVQQQGNTLTVEQQHENEKRKMEDCASQPQPYPVSVGTDSESNIVHDPDTEEVNIDHSAVTCICGYNGDADAPWENHAKFDQSCPRIKVIIDEEFLDLKFKKLQAFGDNLPHQRLKEWLLCKMCFLGFASIALLPCSHFCLCRTCATAATICPACGSPIDQIVEGRLAI